MKKYLLVSFAIIIGAGAVFAQQLPQYSQYMTNSYLINPALAGTEDYIDAKVGYRNQWSSTFGGESPRTMYVTVHSPLMKPHEYYHAKSEHKNWHGIGGSLIGDKTGPTSANSALLSYSYNMGIIRPKGSGIYKKGGVRASFGLMGGIKQYRVDLNKLYTNVDEALGSQLGQLTKMTPELGVGAWIYNDKFYAGLSSMQLLNSNASPNDLKTNVNSKGQIPLTQHYFLTGGANISLSQFVTWVPSILAKGVAGAPLSLDINSRFDYDKKYWVGASYRHSDAVVLMAGAVINYLVEVAYSYDVSISNVSKYNGGGAHEVILGFRIKPATHFHVAERFWK